VSGKVILLLGAATETTLYANYDKILNIPNPTGQNGMTTRVDFYVLPDDYPQTPLVYASRLIEKVYNLGHTLYVHLENEADTLYLDEQLWKISPDSFIPHALATKATGNDPILLGFQQTLTQPANVLVNLSGEIPSFFNRFERVAEIVPGNRTMRDKSRENYRLYQEKGCSVKSHNIKITPQR